MERCRDNKYI